MAVSPKLEFDEKAFYAVVKFLRPHFIIDLKKGEWIYTAWNVYPKLMMIKKGSKCVRKS